MLGRAFDALVDLVVGGDAAIIDEHLDRGAIMRLEQVRHQIADSMRAHVGRHIADPQTPPLLDRRIAPVVAGATSPVSA